MNEFELFAHGVDFDPDAFLKSTSLQFDGTWCKGQVSPKHPKSNGVFKVLGDSQRLSIHDQELIAIEYLSTNREELKKLAKYDGVTTFVLALQHRVKIKPAAIQFAIGTSATLMWHCLNVGVSPVFYVSMDRQDASG